MTYDIYRLIFIVGSIACAVMFVVSVILFITLKIPNVIGDLTGRNAKKAIENIRKQNEASGGKAYKASAVNLERGRLTDKMTPSGNLQRRGITSGFGVHTEKISTMKLEQQASVGMDTDNESNETMVLEQNYSNETTVLSPQNVGETTVLSSHMPQNPSETTVLNQFMVLEDITFIHTDEII
jgi:Sec-independent protein translocase protein TatA